MNCFQHFSNHPAEPAGNIMSTATDMAKWIKFNLNLGRTESGKQLIDKKLMEDIHSLTTPIDSQGSMTKPDYPVSDIILGYGYGWFLSEYRGKQIGNINPFNPVEQDRYFCSVSPDEPSLIDLHCLPLCS